VKRFDVYVETSVWGAAANVEPAYYHDAAAKLLARTDAYNFYLSRVVTEEITAAAAPVRALIEGVIIACRPAELGVTSDVLALADEYLRRGIFPPQYGNDALHVAVASYYAMDYLVSYNFKHIVRVSRRELVKSANVILGYNTPMIVSAEELAEETEE